MEENVVFALAREAQLEVNWSLIGLASNLSSS
jgi:hypothetical protein